MPNTVPESPETKDLSQRELWLLIRQDITRSHEDVLVELRRMNGSVKRHEIDLYGDPEHGVVGVKPKMEEFAAFCARAKVTIRVLAVLGTMLSTGVGTLIGLIIR